ncbi:hypothetical protein BDV95DRAFT_577046 [Massariosphaeria phaeospora]|uniref:Uncharacterized protein n=1 Tax=Massariosphaeria phaeospora TaxID=100035 RepID=A0A7C8I2S1_9PLEO|nr:hypothetical protein BDV95DRAFT_577046 [Massariosphaeria phaeospora]
MLRWLGGRGCNHRGTGACREGAGRARKGAGEVAECANGRRVTRRVHLGMQWARAGQRGPREQRGRRLRRLRLAGRGPRARLSTAIEHKLRLLSPCATSSWHRRWARSRDAGSSGPGRRPVAARACGCSARASWALLLLLLLLLLLAMRPRSARCWRRTTATSTGRPQHVAVQAGQWGSGWAAIARGRLTGLRRERDGSFQG